MAERKGGRGVAWLALLISIVALIFSLISFQASGGREGDLMSEVKKLRERIDRMRGQLADALEKGGEAVRPRDKPEE